jgi:UMF1 family MFS transporter
MDQVREFYLLACMIGCVQGGIQALSRSYYSRLFKEEQAGQFYGFYNLLGKFTGILGPISVGAIGLWTGNPRIAILSIAVIFVMGGFVLRFVDENKSV